MLTLEDQLTAVLKTLCPRVFPDIAPVDTAPTYVVWHMFGGRSVNYVEGPQAGRRNANVQVNTWATSRGAANTLSLQIAEALHAHPTLQAEAMSELNATWDEETGLYGAMQDFTLWAVRG